MITKDFKENDYSSLTHLQVGRVGEYWTKLQLSFAGFDIYTSEVDDKGIDFVIRTDDQKHIDIQVKTIREKTKYVFVTKESWQSGGLRGNLVVALVILANSHLPKLYLIPSTVWQEPNEIFKSKDYVGLKSKPEWGINISVKNMEILSQYESSKMIKAMVDL